MQFTTPREALDTAWNTWISNLPAGGLHGLHPVLQVDVDRRREQGLAPPGWLIIEDMPRFDIDTWGERTRFFYTHGYRSNDVNDPTPDRTHLLSALNAAMLEHWLEHEQDRFEFYTTEEDEAFILDELRDAIEAGRTIVVAHLRDNELDDYADSLAGIDVAGFDDPYLDVVKVGMVDNVIRNLDTEDMENVPSDQNAFLLGMEEVPADQRGTLLMYVDDERNRPYGPNELDLLREQLNELHGNAPGFSQSWRIIGLIEANANPNHILEVANTAMAMHGVEGLDRYPRGHPDHGDPGDTFALLLNSGDMYAGTLAYLVDDDRWIVTTLADLRHMLDEWRIENGIADEEHDDDDDEDYG